MNLKENKETIDIREDYLLKKDNLLEILLQDKTTGKNIRWATDELRMVNDKSRR